MNHLGTHVNPWRGKTAVCSRRQLFTYMYESFKIQTDTDVIEDK